MGKMKNLAAGLITAAALIFSSCAPMNLSGNTDTSDETSRSVYINGSSQSNSYAFYTYSLSSYNNKTVTLDFSVKMTVSNSGSGANLMWQVNTNDYPIVASQWVENGTHTYYLSGSKKVTLGTNNQLYLSTYNTTPANFQITLDNLSVSVQGSSTPSVTGKEVIWTDATSLKSAYSKYFTRFGMETTQAQLGDKKVQAGVKHHVNSTTMENEFKPDFVFNWPGSIQTQSWTSSKGVTIQVPKNTPSWTRFDDCLSKCKDLGIQMRGHVLVWHSQTPEFFFRQNYNANGALVSAREMDARQEWYIQTVLSHVSYWEKTYNNGNHIIYAWDVVNEAVADDASGNNWLRGSTNNTYNKAPAQGGSRWFQIYGNSDFIVNAFRYANKYAPSDVELCYNDYNEYMDNKTDGILKLISAVQAASRDSNLPARIDVMGMQSHVSLTWPSASSYENAIKKYVAKGLNVQITELDVAHGSSAYDAGQMQARYKELLTACVNNCKTASRKGVEGVTVWGVDDATSWLQNSNSTPQSPLLFKKNANGDYVVKATYYGVLEAAGK